MQGVCMAVMVLMVGTDIETPHILCRLVVSSTCVLLVEDQLSDKYRRDHAFGGGESGCGKYLSAPQGV